MNFAANFFPGAGLSTGGTVASVWGPGRISAPGTPSQRLTHKVRLERYKTRLETGSKQG